MDKKIVIVTGASRGIGKEIGLAFGAHGYGVCINYLKEKEKALAVQKKIEEKGGAAIIVAADVSKKAPVDSLVNAVVKEYGRIDVLINNAGVARDRTIMKMSEEEWDSVIATDLKGPFLMIQACGRVMSKQKQGSIITIGSIAGVRGAYGAANYASAKAGIIGLTRSAAKELGRFNIGVNAVLPGFHLTDMGRSVPESYAEKARAESVLGRTTDIRELTRFVIMLSETTTVSGQVFTIDSRIT